MRCGACLAALVVSGAISPPSPAFHPGDAWSFNAAFRDRRGPEASGEVAAAAVSALDLEPLALPELAELPALAAMEDAPAPAPGASVGSSDADLAKQSQNPVADLISLPFQDNIGFRVGPGKHVQNVLNIQPVVPFKLTEDWNLITRTIVPVIYQPELAPGVGDAFGFGDIQFTAFLSPRKPREWIWGIGPVIQFPSATDESLGARKWTAGPSVVVLRMDGPWVYGALAQNVWSFAGSGDRSVNQMLVQPFVNYNLPHQWYLVTAPIITADWRASSGDRWVVPLGGGIGKVFRIGHQPCNAQVQAFYNAARPDVGPDWTLRLQFQLLFPTK